MVLLGLEAALVSLPATGVWRVTDWYEPLEPPEPPRPLREADPEVDEGRRWDAPDGEFRTLYCATDAAGAFGEKLADFALPQGVPLEIEDFLEGDTDEEFAGEVLTPGLNRAEVEQLNWKLAWAPPAPDQMAIDVSSGWTFLSLLPRIGGLLVAFGFPGRDATALKTSRRALTRRIAGVLHASSLTDSGDLRAFGIRYESRLPPAWECWALWEPLPLEVDEARISGVTIDDPNLRAAAALLDVPLREE
jgi:hypothetical protein